MVEVTVTPQSSLADQPVRLLVRGLPPWQLITLRASLTDEQGEHFQARAFFRATATGEVDPGYQPALGGNYSGVCPMGLFWFLQPDTPFRRLLKRDVASSPFLVHLEVFGGYHLAKQPEEKPLATCVAQRWFVAPGTRRLPIRDGRVRGALYLPPGPGPFAGVIDLFGGGGGLIEFRAGLLASKGFAVLALAFFAYEDLPSTLTRLDMDYFEEATRVLLRHPQVRGPGLGVIGVSKGAEVALAMASFLPTVVATVWINGTSFLYNNPLVYGPLLTPSIPYRPERAIITPAGAIDNRAVFPDPREPSCSPSAIPVERIRGKVLFVVGEADRSLHSKLFAQLAMARMSPDGYRLLSYPGAGHLLEPPCSPLCRVSGIRGSCRPVLWGGEGRLHLEAQEHSWKEIVGFFKGQLVATVAASSIPVATSSIPVAASSIPVATSSIPVAASSIPVGASSIPVATSSIPAPAPALSLLGYRYECGDHGMQLLAFPLQGRTVRFKVLDEFGSRFDVANCSICLHWVSTAADGAVVFSSGYDGCHVLVKEHRYVLRVQLEELLLSGALAASYQVNLTCPKPPGDYEVLTEGNRGHQPQTGVLRPLSQPGLLHQLSQSSLSLSGSHLSPQSHREQGHPVAQTQPVLVHQSQSSPAHPGLQSSPAHPGLQSSPGRPGLQSQSNQGRPGLQSSQGRPVLQSQSSQGRPGLQYSQASPGLQSQSNQGRPGLQSQSSPAHPGLQSQSSQGHPGLQSQSSPAHPGLQYSQSHPGLQSQSNQGRPGLQSSPVRPGLQSSPARPGLQSQSSPARPGLQSSPAHPGLQSQWGLMHPARQPPVQPGLLHPGLHPHSQAALLHPGAPSQPLLRPGLQPHSQAGSVQPREPAGTLPHSQAALSQPGSQPPNQSPLARPSLHSQSQTGLLHNQAMLVHSRPAQAAPGLQSRPGMIRPGLPSHSQPGLGLSRLQPGLLHPALRPQPGLLQSTALFYPSAGTGAQLTREQCQVPLGKLPCVAPQGRDACVQAGCCYDDLDRGTPCYYGNTATVQCLLNGHFVVVVPRGLGTQPYNLDSVRLATTDPGCEPARLSEAFVLFHFPVTHCGTTVQVVEDQLIYENQLISTIDVQGTPRGSITRDSVYILQARCIYNSSDLLPLRMEVAVPPTAIPMAMLGPLGLQLRIATDETYSSYHPVGDYPLVKVLRDPIYVEVRLLQKTDPNLVLVLHHCWASPSASAVAEPQWPILVDGCPFTGDNYRTQLVAVGPASPQLPFPSHLQRFVISTFAFVEPPTAAVLEGEVFISCSASVCHLAQPEPCRPSCQLGVPSRARRALTPREPAEAVGTATSQGPIVIPRAPELLRG